MLQGLDEATDVAVVGLQEVSRPSRGWKEALAAPLQRGWSICADTRYAGMRLLVFVQKRVRDRVIPHRAMRVGAGVADRWPNKGAVAIEFRIDRTTTVCIVAAHLAAQEGNLKEREEDWERIVRKLETVDSVGADSIAVPLFLRYDHLFVMGDLNYRLAPTLEATCTTLDRANWVQEKISQRDWASLAAVDELANERQAKNVFVNFSEGPLNFAPTFKFDPGAPSSSPYNPSRVPSYCDRVLWHSLPSRDALVDLITYNALHDITASDHRPVQAQFNLKPALSPLRLSLRSERGIRIVLDFQFVRFHRKDEQRVRKARSLDDDSFASSSPSSPSMRPLHRPQPLTSTGQLSRRAMAASDLDTSSAESALSFDADSCDETDIMPPKYPVRSATAAAIATDVSDKVNPGTSTDSVDDIAPVVACNSSTAPQNSDSACDPRSVQTTQTETPKTNAQTEHANDFQTPNKRLWIDRGQSSIDTLGDSSSSSWAMHSALLESGEGSSSRQDLLVTPTAGLESSQSVDSARAEARTRPDLLESSSSSDELVALDDIVIGTGPRSRLSTIRQNQLTASVTRGRADATVPDDEGSELLLLTRHARSNSDPQSLDFSKACGMSRDSHFDPVKRDSLLRMPANFNSNDPSMSDATPTSSSSVKASRIPSREDRHSFGSWRMDVHGSQLFLKQKQVYRAELPRRKDGARFASGPQLPAIPLMPIRSLEELRHEHLRISFSRPKSRIGSCGVLPMSELIDHVGQPYAFELKLTKYGREAGHMEACVKLTVSDSRLWKDGDGRVVRTEDGRSPKFYTGSLPTRQKVHSARKLRAQAVRKAQSARAATKHLAQKLDSLASDRG